MNRFSATWCLWICATVFTTRPLYKLQSFSNASTFLSLPFWPWKLTKWVQQTNTQHSLTRFASFICSVNSFCRRTFFPTTSNSNWPQNVTSSRLVDASYLAGTITHSTEIDMDQVQIGELEMAANLGHIVLNDNISPVPLRAPISVTFRLASKVPHTIQIWNKWLAQLEQSHKCELTLKRAILSETWDDYWQRTIRSFLIEFR